MLNLSSLSAQFLHPPQQLDFPSGQGNSTTHQAVTQEANAEYLDGASVAAQEYGPPLVGSADTISAMLSATKKLKNDTTIQLIIIVPGPPVAKQYPNNAVTVTGTACARQGVSIWSARPIWN